MESNINFVIPVYENMPSTASTKPGRNVTLTTEDVVVTTLFTPLTIRSGPSTSYYEKAKAPIGTILTRIERANEVSSDGRYWDRVAYIKGGQVIIGYASREYLGDVATTEKLNEQATISVMCALKNGPASTVNTKVKQILQPGTTVTIIDKLAFSEFGHTWYRVKLADGTQGYVSSAYIQTGPVEKYRIEETNILVTPDTVATDIPNAILQGTVFGTGAKVTIEGREYTIVMIGDANGDGTIDSADLLKIVKHLKGISTIEIEKTGDTNCDGGIDSADLLKIVKYLKGTSNITI